MSTETELYDLRQRIVFLEGKVEFLYKRLGLDIDAEPEEVDDSAVVAALQRGNLIEAIKAYREIYNVGLAEAKFAVEDIKAKLRL